MQNDNTQDKTNNTKSSDKNPLKINLAYLDSNNTTDRIFGMTAFMEKTITLHPMKSKYENAIHYKEVKHSTSDDSKQLKD